MSVTPIKRQKAITPSFEELDKAEVFTRDTNAQLAIIQYDDALQSVGVIERAFSGLSVSDEDIRDAAKVRATIIEQTEKTLEAQIVIGRSLTSLSERLKPAAFRAFIETHEVFPFGPNMAYRLMRIVKELPRLQQIENPPLELTALPPSASTIYELCTLDNGQLVEAKKIGLLSPTTIRSDVMKFKGQKKAGDNDKIGNLRIKEALLKQKHRLERKLAEIAIRLAALD